MYCRKVVAMSEYWVRMNMIIGKYGYKLKYIGVKMICQRALGGWFGDLSSVAWFRIRPWYLLLKNHVWKVLVDHAVKKVILKYPLYVSLLSQ